MKQGREPGECAGETHPTELGACLVCSGNSQKASAATAERARTRLVWDRMWDYRGGP